MDDSFISVGMVDGHLVTQKRRDASEIEEEKERRRQEKKTHYKVKLPAKTFVDTEVVGRCNKLIFESVLRKYFCDFQSVLIEHTRKQHLAKYDRFFKKFEYGKVLTSIIDVRRFPQLHTQSARQNFP